jgi:hypothetical protein
MLRRERRIEFRGATRRPLVSTYRMTGIALALTLLLAGVSHATRENLTEDEFKCQSTAGKELGKLGATWAKCITKCEQESPMSPTCRPGLHTGDTQSCVAKAQTQASAKIIRKCDDAATGHDSFPECFADAHGTAANFDYVLRQGSVNGAMSAATDFTFCDDAPFPYFDVLTPAETTCQLKLSVALGKYAKAMTACFVKCFGRDRKGETNGSCDPNAMDPTVMGPIPDTELDACIDKALAKVTAAGTKYCADPPECFQGMSGAERGEFLALGAVLLAANPVAVCGVCGDGVLDVNEYCDPPGTPGGNCFGSQVCATNCNHCE